MRMTTCVYIRISAIAACALTSACAVEPDRLGERTEPAQSSVQQRSSADAVTYWYMPSHPMNQWPVPLSDSHCTGGWGIRSSLNYPYFLTAAHCWTSIGNGVYGTTGRLGLVANAWAGGVDSAIVVPDEHVGGWQEIPGVGRTIGKMGNDFATTVGAGIAKQGMRTGLTYGTLSGGWYLWAPHDEPQAGVHRVACGTYHSAGGDSGGPVFIHFGSQVYAVGIHLGRIRLTNGSTLACFMTIDDLLTHWNAWLPVFAASARGDTSPGILLAPEPSSAADALPVERPLEVMPD